MAYLLDTNAWIHYLKQTSDRIANRLAQTTPGKVVTCSVVKAELLHGAEKYGNRERRRQTVLRTLGPLKSIPFDDYAADEYATIRHNLEVAGQMIGPNDLQIAAICRVYDFTLVTSNIGEFQRVPNLQLEDWLAD